MGTAASGWAGPRRTGILDEVWPAAFARSGGWPGIRERLRLIDTGPANSDGYERLPEIPGFVILGECGRGGMGVVYLAEQLDLGRRVALKFLRPELAGSASQRARLLVEATALARLQHPNIVQIFSSGTHEGRSFIVQEYVGGESLHRRLMRQPRRPRSPPGWSQRSPAPSSTPTASGSSIVT